MRHNFFSTVSHQQGDRTFIAHTIFYFRMSRCWPNFLVPPPFFDTLDTPKCGSFAARPIAVIVHYQLPFPKFGGGSTIVTATCEPHSTILECCHLQ